MGGARRDEDRARAKDYAGRVAGGIFRVGDRVHIHPGENSTRITGISSPEGEIPQAYPPLAVTFFLEDELDVSRGSLLTLQGQPPFQGNTLKAMIAWMAEKPLQLNRRYALKHTTRWVKAKVTCLDFEVDIHRPESPRLAQNLQLNGIGCVCLETTEPLFYDAYSQSKSMGAFILVDETTHATVAAGMLLDPDFAKHGIA